MMVRQNGSTIAAIAHHHLPPYCSLHRPFSKTNHLSINLLHFASSISPRSAISSATIRCNRLRHTCATCAPSCPLYNRHLTRRLQSQFNSLPLPYNRHLTRSQIVEPFNFEAPFSLTSQPPLFTNSRPSEMAVRKLS